MKKLLFLCVLLFSTINKMQANNLATDNDKTGSITGKVLDANLK